MTSGFATHGQALQARYGEVDFEAERQGSQCDILHTFEKPCHNGFPSHYTDFFSKINLTLQSDKETVNKFTKIGLKKGVNFPAESGKQVYRKSQRKKRHLRRSKMQEISSK